MNLKTGSAFRPVFRPYRPVLSLDDLLSQRKSDPDASLCRMFPPIKSLKNMGDIFLRKAFTVIPDLDLRIERILLIKAVDGAAQILPL